MRYLRTLVAKVMLTLVIFAAASQTALAAEPYAADLPAVQVEDSFGTVTSSDVGIQAYSISTWKTEFLIKLSLLNFYISTRVAVSEHYVKQAISRGISPSFAAQTLVRGQQYLDYRYSPPSKIVYDWTTSTAHALVESGGKLLLTTIYEGAFKDWRWMDIWYW